MRIYDRRSRAAAVLRGPASLMIALAGCGGDGSTAPTPGSSGPRFTIVAGGGATDTVQAHLLQALIVEIRDSTGRVARGHTVRFESLPVDDVKRKTETAILVSPLNANLYGTFGADVTDSTGRAKILIGFGTVAGPARVRVTVPEFGMVDTVAFTVKSGSPAKFIVGTRDTLVQPNATYSLNTTVVDRFTNTVSTEMPTFSAGAGIVSVSPSGQVVVGSGIARAQILITWKTLVDTAHVSVMPRLPLVGTRYGNSRTVVLVNTDGSNYTELATSSDQSLSPHSVAASNAVVFYQGDPGYNASVWIVQPGSAARALVSSANGFQVAAWPRFSPDGQWVYFIGGRQLPNTHALFRIKADGSQVDSLGVGASPYIYAAASISPDGSTAALEAVGGIKLITVATKAARMVSVPCTGPRYSPDGTRFACVRNGVLTVMNVDGTGARSLSSVLQFNDLSNADWSPDGKWLIATNLGSVQVLVNAADGSTIPVSALVATYGQMSFIR